MPEINQEQVNDRAKLMMHRIVARRLGRDPGMVDLAKSALADRAEHMPGRTFLAEWQALLDLPRDELRAALTGRGETMDRLRLSSPFMMIEDLGLDDVPLRRRIWRLARRGLELRSQPEESMDASPAGP